VYEVSDRAVKAGLGVAHADDGECCVRRVRAARGAVGTSVSLAWQTLVLC
jgi:hypothetical protein